MKTGLVIWGILAAAQGEFAYAQHASPALEATGDAVLAQATTPAMQPQVFVDSAPSRYTVVRGDTLWGIAKRFLKNPLQWPSIWRMNRQQIKDPHWIYPGQVIVIDRLHGTMYLEGQDAQGNTIVVKPEVRLETSEQAIPSIPQDAIEPFLSQPLVVDSENLDNAPRIIGSKTGRVVLGRGDIAYAAGIKDPSIISYQVFRPGEPLKDPETGKVVAYQAEYLGSAQVTRVGDPATLVITSFAEEITNGDRLVPASAPVLVNYVPHAPAAPIKGRIITALHDDGYAGKNMIVVLNRGASDGLEIGNVLAVQTAGEEIIDTTGGGRTSYKLPDERNGLVFVFRVFNHISYALVLEANVEMQANDVFMQP